MFYHAPLLQAISSAALARRSEFDQQNLQNTLWSFSVLDVIDSPLFDALSAASLARGDLGRQPLEAINSLCWSFWKISLASEALRQFTSYVTNCPLVDSLLLGQIIFDVEWQKRECFFDYEALLLMHLPPLESRVEA